MDQFKPPQPLILSGNVGENWRRWAQRFHIYMTASGADSKPEKVKIAILLHALGEEALEVYNTLHVVREGVEETMNDILKAVDAYCLPKKNVVFERHQFWAYAMADSASVGKYVTELKQKSKDCEFGGSENNMIRDKIVFSVNDQHLKERLLREPELTLEKAIDLCRAAEIAKSQMQAMGEQSKVIHAMQKKVTEAKQNRRPEKAAFPPKTNMKTCRKCANSHRPRQCPAYGATRRMCGKQNHYAKMCTSSKAPEIPQRKNAVVDALFVRTLCIHHIAESADSAWYSDIDIGNMSVRFKLDTGAEANVLPYNIFQRLQRPTRLDPTSTMLIAYDGAKLKPEGISTLQCNTGKAQVCLPFYIMKHCSTPILGREACDRMRLVRRVEPLSTKSPATKEELIARFPTVFKGLGQFPGEHHIHVDPDVPPVIHGCRKIPLAVMDRLKDTLDELLEAGVIARVTEPTAWVNSLVVTEKRNGALRVCLDPRDLNKAVLRQHFSIPTTEDVLCKLADKKVFSILDEKDGYWQVKLDKESSLLCTFNTPWGRYRFKRLPFGIKSASEVFQQHNCETFGDIEGVHIVADDMIIAATSEQQHDEVMSKVMERAVNVGIKFNPDKIQYKVNTVRFMGHVVTPDGVKADESKVQAISDMPHQQISRHYSVFWA